MNTIRTNNKIQVILFSRYGKMDLTPFVVSCTTSKDISSPEGKWSVTLKPFKAKDENLGMNLMVLLGLAAPKEFRRVEGPDFYVDLFRKTFADDFIGIWMDNGDQAPKFIVSGGAPSLGATTDISVGTLPGFVPVMMGPIATIQRNQTVVEENGVIVTTFTIHGEDWGKIFTRTDCWLDPQDGQLELGFAPTMKAMTGVYNAQGDISDVLPKIMGGMIVNLGQWIELPQCLWDWINESGKGRNALPTQPSNSKGFNFLMNSTTPLTGYNKKKGTTESPVAKYILLNIASNVEGAYIQKNIADANSNLWSLCKDISSEVIHEMFVDWVYFDNDYEKVFPVVTVRRYPYDIDQDKDFFNLPAVSIPRTNTIESNITRSDRELYNYFNLPYEGFSITTNNFSKMAGIHRSDPSIRKHGRRRFSKNLQTVPHSIQQSDIFPKSIQQWMNTNSALVAKWYQINHQLYSGSMKLYGEPRIKVGMRLDLLDKIPGTDTLSSSLGALTGTSEGTSYGVAEQYYIERVEHNFQVLEGGARHYVTTVDVTRGLITNVTKTDIVEDVANFIDGNPNPNASNMLGAAASFTPNTFSLMTSGYDANNPTERYYKGGK